MDEKIYNFTKKSFKKAYNLADELYFLCVVLEDFCAYHKTDCEIINLVPFAKILRNKADELNFFFCGVDMDIAKDGIELD